MKVAAIQMCSGLDPSVNLGFAVEQIALSAELGCELVVLPEYFCLLGQRDTDKLAIAEELGHGYLQDGIRQAAAAHRLWVVAGTLPIKAASGRVCNASLVFNPDGEIVARYDKIHLFAFDNGRESYDESRVLEAGSQPTAFQLESVDGQSWRIALSVCYDLRFPELYRSLRPDLILVPSAFTYTTGHSHWEVLLRARAVENLAYVVAPAQAGHHENGRRTWGHSMILDAWGQVLAQCADAATGLIHADLDFNAMQKHRAQLPALNHRRL
jgi:deaminated glutathione amidase